jgi:hypothetical protein
MALNAKLFNRPLGLPAGAPPLPHPATLPPEHVVMVVGAEGEGGFR